MDHHLFRMPAEWEPHVGVWLSWPRVEVDPPDRYVSIYDVYVALIREFLKSEEVHINFWDSKMESLIRKILTEKKLISESLFLHPFPTDDSWCRDNGPNFVVRDGIDSENGAHRQRAIVNWTFNSWGSDPSTGMDNQIPSRVAVYRSLPLFQPEMVLEGGSIDVNGCGTLLTTKACLLSSNRNPNLTQAQIEDKLKEFLGVTHILWLERGIDGDLTSGHVDEFARFVSPNTVVTVVESNPNDANYEILQRNLELLRGMKDQDGVPLKIVELPMPSATYYVGQRLPASYANFYIANHAVIVPTFCDKHDGETLDILRGCFKDREVVGIDGRELVWCLGAFHCITQQEPK